MTFFEATVYDRTWFVVLKLLVSAVGSAGAVVVCFLGTQHYFVQLGSHDWPEATMTVIRSSRSGNTGVAVDYSFMVEGKTYSGSRVLDGGVAPATSRQEEVLKEYARSTAHPVYYNPENPAAYSVLKRGGSGVPQLLGSLLIGVIAVPLAINAVRQSWVLRYQLV